MDLPSLIAGFTVGVLVGIGAALYYIKYKMNQQIGMMEQQMDEMMEATQGLADGFEDLEDAERKDKDQKIADFEAPTERPDKDKKDEDKEN
jgi:hypothetical protein